MGVVWCVVCGVCWKRHQNGEKQEDGKEKEKNGVVWVEMQSQQVGCGSGSVWEEKEVEEWNKQNNNKKGKKKLEKVVGSHVEESNG